MSKIVPKKIRSQIPYKVLKADLEQYKKMCLEIGATEAKIIDAKNVIIDERIRMKCEIPRCYSYGESPNCPPYAPEPEKMRQVINKYNYAILFKNDVKPVEDFADPIKWHSDHISHYAKTIEIVGRIEAQAFNDGYYLALGFSAGTCKVALCNGLPCQFLDSGRCRFPLKARPSMEAIGIDVYDIATKVGWNVFPIGNKNVDPKDVPCAISVGIVFIY